MILLFAKNEEKYMDFAFCRRSRTIWNHMIINYVAVGGFSACHVERSLISYFFHSIRSEITTNYVIIICKT